MDEVVAGQTLLFEPSMKLNDGCFRGRRGGVGGRMSEEVLRQIVDHEIVEIEGKVIVEGRQFGPLLSYNFKICFEVRQNLDLRSRQLGFLLAKVVGYHFRGSQLRK